MLTVNLLTAFRVSVFDLLSPQTAPKAPLDAAIARFMSAGLEFKAITIFSFLFGAGLAAQADRGKVFLVKRLAFLLVLGLAHLYLVWNGDILTLYALVGLVVVPFLGLPAWVLLALALACFTVLVLPLPWPWPFASREAMEQHIDFARHVYPYGNFLQVLSFRIQEVRPISYLLLWTVPRTFCLFFLGASAWKAGVFHGKRRRIVSLVAVLGVVAGAVLVQRERTASLASVLHGLGYSAILLLAFDQPSLARVRAAFVPIGRMSLTSYLTQSVVLGFVFYGYGLGLFGRLGEASAFAIGIALYLAQMIASALWLRRYPMGPAERLWRRVSQWA